MNRSAAAVPRSLVWATDVDVLPADRTVERDGDHLVIRSPGNPGHWWGNFLLYDDAPRSGDGVRWEREFAAAFADDPEVRHRTFAWDRTDGATGAAPTELVARGYALDATAGLIADPHELREHPRASGEVAVRALDPAPGADEDLWRQALAVTLAGWEDDHHGASRAENERFSRSRQQERREMFAAGGRGAWYVAITGDDEVVGACGVVASGPRGRYQAVDVLASHRRRGIARRLIVDAGRHAAQTADLTSLVIAADPDYHAIGIYESVGFAARERVTGALMAPTGDS